MKKQTKSSPQGKQKSNKGKQYSKRVTLYPLSDAQALMGLLKTPPIKREQKLKIKQGEKK